MPLNPANHLKLRASFVHKQRTVREEASQGKPHEYDIIGYYYTAATAAVSSIHKVHH